MAQYDVNLREYWRIVRKRKFTVLVIALILGAFSTTFAIFKAPTPIYETFCVIELKKEAIVEGVYNQTVSWSDSDDIETQMTVIKSYAVFERAAERMALIPRGSQAGDSPQFQAHVITVIDSLQRNVEVSRQKYSSILNIKVTDENPLFAQRLANTVALVYKELHGEQQTRRAREALRYIEDQLKDVREKLREAEDRFNRYSKENELLSIDLQSENLVAQAQEIRKERAKLEEEKIEFEGISIRLAKFIENPVGSGHNFDSLKASSRYHNANDALVSLLLKRDTLLREFTPKHPEVMAINDEINESARKMEYLLQLHLKGVQRRQEDLSRELESIDEKSKRMLDKKLEFNRLKREVELYTEMTTLLERKNQEALIRRSEKPEEVNIVKPALLPTNPINPPRSVATGVLGVIIGFIFGLVVAFILETFDTSLGAIEDVEETLKTPVLGVIPQVDLKDIQETLQERGEGKIGEHAAKQAVNLISHFVPKSMMAESFRALRANIQFRNGENKVKTLAITSASPQEGKTAVSLNLAVTMGQAGMKTLLVGSDLRKPSLARILGIESGLGLSDALLGNCSWRETVRTVTDLLMGEMGIDEITMTPGLDNLSFIPAGSIPPNPAELIESEHFDRFVEESKSEYDIVIFDTAPILSAVDAVLIGIKVDGMLLLYRVGAVSRGLLRRAMNQLEQVKSRVIGAVLNGMRPEMSPDFDDYKHYKYYYSYGDDGKKHPSKKKPLSFFGRDGAVPASLLEKGAKKRGKRSALGSSLLLGGVVLLGAGFLWHNGFIDLSRLPGFGGPITKAPPSSEKPVNPSEPLRREVRETLQGEAAKEAPVVPVATVKPAGVPVSAAPPLPVLPETSSGPALAEEKPAPVPTSAPVPGPLEKSPDPVAARVVPANAPVQDASFPAPAALPHRPEAEAGKASAPKDPPAALFPFALFLGSAPYPDQAEKGMAEYRRRGLETYWVEVELSRGTWYRIYTGYFQSREEAEDFKEEKRLKQAEVKELPYANLVGTFGSLKEAEAQVQALKKQGFSSYVVNEPQGACRVFIGAFHNEARAQRQDAVLRAKGIESEIVRR